MTIEATAISRVKEFKFRVEVNGLPVALVQEFDPGRRTHGVTEHAGAGQNHPVKEAGMIKFGNARLRMVVPIGGEGKDFWEKFLNKAQDPSSGNGGPPSQYRANFSFYDLGPDGNAVRVWEFKGAFAVEHNAGGNRSGLSDNKDEIEEVEIAYNSRTLRNLG